MNKLSQIGKIPPQALDIEEVVLGAMLIDSTGVDKALEVITTPKVFYKSEHQNIFKAIIALNESSDPIDLITVSEKLTKVKKLDESGGQFYLINLTQKVSSSAHIDHHCRLLMQQFIKRELISMGTDMITKSYQEDADVFDVMDDIESRFTSISEMINNGKRAASWVDSLKQVAKRVEFLTSNEGDVTGVTTGLKRLDKHFGGWQKQDLIVIGARPGMGKTAFTINNMIAAAKSGVAVGFMSMEMSDVQLATRAVSVNSNFHMKQLNQTGFEHPKYFTTLNSLIVEMQELPIHIDDRPSLTIGDIKRKARTWKRKHNIGILIVDYVQLAGGHPDIRVRTGETSRGLKHIAKELDIPVIGLSQLSRAVETQGGAKRPALHHLKEAGDIEQDADVVGFLYRPAYYGFDLEENLLEVNANTEFITSKNRNGALGITGIYFEENKTKFLDSKPDYHYQDNEVPY